MDAADRENVAISKNELHDLLNKPSLHGIPLLVLGNKIDKLEALTKKALIEQMYVMFCPLVFVAYSSEVASDSCIACQRYNLVDDFDVVFEYSSIVLFVLHSTPDRIRICTLYQSV